MSDVINIATPGTEKKIWLTEYARLLNNKFSSFLNNRFFSVEVKEGLQVVDVTVLLRNDDESFYYPVQMQIRHKHYSLKAFEAASILFDFSESYFEDFFANTEAVYLPIDLSPFRMGDYEIMAKGQIHNKYLEKLGDAWLEQSQSSIQ